MGNSQARAIPELDLAGGEVYIMSDNELWERHVVDQLHPGLIRPISLLIDFIIRDLRGVQKVNADAGDMIEFLGEKSKWAVCTGGGKAAFRTEHGLVKEEDIGRIAGGRSYQVNNKFDRKLKPLSANLVIKDVHRQLGRRCAEETDELFVTQLRYGIACSNENPPPNIGEMLCFLFQSHEHWGIYIGDNSVVYLDRGLQEGFSEPSETAYVQEIPLNQVKDIRVINKYDQMLKPKKQGDITMEAKQKTGERMTWGEKNDTDQLFVTELRYGLKFSDKRPLPEVGDLIEFLCDFKNHWGVYVGDGKVVHRTEFGLVEEAYVGRVSDGRPYRVNNRFDRKLNPRSGALVIKDVRSQFWMRCAEDNDELFVTRLRYGIACSDERPLPEAGDLVQFLRDVKNHWGVYVGDGKVVHRTEFGLVEEDYIARTAGVHSYRVNNKFDRKLKPRSGTFMIMDVRSQLGMRCAEENDELFVTRLRYGIACSDENPPPDAGEILCYSFQNQEHWGIYTGDSTVVYLDRGLQEGFSEPSETAYVQEIPLNQLKDIKVINKYDQMLKPKKQGDITIEAKQRIGEKMIWGEDNDTDQLFVTELRYGIKASNKQPPPEPGDLIEFVRLWGVYSHWGVYVGDGNLVHLQPDSSSIFDSLSSFRHQCQAMSSAMIPVSLLDQRLMAKSIISDKDGKVLEEPVKSVAKGSKYRVNNSYDKYYEPRRKEDIVETAKQYVGKKMTYNLCKYNCEHFATFMRYGVAFSKQVEEWTIPHLFCRQNGSCDCDIEAFLAIVNDPTLQEIRQLLQQHGLDLQAMAQLHHNYLTL
ncbi:uncharacterized protein LOC108699156 isoform X2 [Xenopus laevis]|uniref:Uncharacterized protein LOC108699156 isoform X2 n=1 Tax=Xenopus laevis TaxID=8355 RepID=A0A8J0TJ70_XENLA|nr:uncharacterized protein LOC108699156 isoform X2 [Xenopus laevis]